MQPDEKKIAPEELNKGNNRIITIQENISTNNDVIVDTKEDTDEDLITSIHDDTLDALGKEEVQGALIEEEVKCAEDTRRTLDLVR